MTTQQKMISMFVVGLVVGGGATWLWLDRSTGTTLSDNDMGSTTATQTATVNGSGALDVTVSPITNTTTASATADSGSTLSVTDQPAGMTVAVQSVSVASPTWVVIYEDANGVPGRALGAQLFETGSWSGVVQLLRGTMAGGTYYATLQADNGDRTLDIHTDMPVMGSEGKAVTVMFKAQ